MTIMYRVMNISEKKIYAWFYDLIDAEDYLKELGLGDSGVIDEVKIDNELADETEQLKQEYWKLKHRHSLLHDVCLDTECDRDGYHKDVLSLEKENEQLKEALIELKEIGDYQYMRIKELSDENEQLEKENQEMSNIISAIEKGSCRSIDSFLDDYCTDEILKEFDFE